MEIAILILTHNEESHLPRVLDNVKNIGDVFVVDSYSTDRTTEILDQYGIKYYQRKFDYHYKQANHGIDIINKSGDYDYIVRLDADEYFVGDTETIRSYFTALDPTANGFKVQRTIYFLGEQPRFSKPFSTNVVRIFRPSCGVYEQRLVDEHLIINGEVRQSKIVLVDKNLKGLDFWLKKHINYAALEAENRKFSRKDLMSSRSLKRYLVNKIYEPSPTFVKLSLVFIYWGILKMQFFNGKLGCRYIFFMMWYRLLVEIKSYAR